MSFLPAFWETNQIGSCLIRIVWSWPWKDINLFLGEKSHSSQHVPLKAPWSLAIMGPLGFISLPALLLSTSILNDLAKPQPRILRCSKWKSSLGITLLSTSSPGSLSSAPFQPQLWDQGEREENGAFQCCTAVYVLWGQSLSPSCWVSDLCLGPFRPALHNYRIHQIRAGKDKSGQCFVNICLRTGTSDTTCIL